MSQFLISLVFFVLALAGLWAVLHWVGYKKRPNTCVCGKGACLTDKRHGASHHHAHDGGHCDCGE